ncbi:hypothetical protein [Silvanigrella sp.]|jgi:hypothetical protein|uniref:hypothetical protein n=1 Tax=Silvanigrella sp. TaxID=2024976 RepID=UPI0037CC9586
MIKIKYIFITSTYFSLIANSQEKSFVVCSRKNNPIIWNWATHKNGDYIEVTGYHLYGRCDNTNYSKENIQINGQIMFFVLDPQSVSLVKSACPNGYHFQPAQRSQDVWYHFAEVENNRIVKIYDGYKKCLTSSGEYEKEVSIYCSNKKNRSDWYWAISKDQFRYFRITVFGEWVNSREIKKFHSTSVICRNENIFVISENDFFTVIEACKNDFLPHPAGNIANPNWYRFGVKSNLGIQVLSGYVDSDCREIAIPRIG